MSEPIVFSTPDPGQKVDQDTEKDKGKSNQKPQNRIHHAYLQRIDSMLELKNVRDHTAYSLRSYLYYIPV